MHRLHEHEQLVLGSARDQIDGSVGWNLIFASIEVKPGIVSYLLPRERILQEDGAYFVAADDSKPVVGVALLRAPVGSDSGFSVELFCISGELTHFIAMFVAGNGLMGHFKSNTECGGHLGMFVEGCSQTNQICGDVTVQDDAAMVAWDFRTPYLR